MWRNEHQQRGPVNVLLLYLPPVDYLVLPYHVLSYSILSLLILGPSLFLSGLKKSVTSSWQAQAAAKPEGNTNQKSKGEGENQGERKEVGEERKTN